MSNHIVPGETCTHVVPFHSLLAAWYRSLVGSIKLDWGRLVRDQVKPLALRMPILNNFQYNGALGGILKHKSSLFTTIKMETFV